MENDSQRDSELFRYRFHAIFFFLSFLYFWVYFFFFVLSFFQCDTTNNICFLCVFVCFWFLVIHGDKRTNVSYTIHLLLFNVFSQSRYCWWCSSSIYLFVHNYGIVVCAFFLNSVRWKKKCFSHPVTVVCYSTHN